MVAYAALPSTTCFGTSTIDGAAMQRAAWWLDVTPLYRSPDRRGSDRLIPGVAGARPYRRRRTASRYSLPFLITGQFDAAGAASPTPEETLEANVAWIESNICADPGPTAGTRSFAWTLLSGATVTAAVHVLGIGDPTFRPGALIRTTLELSVPGGDLHL